MPELSQASDNKSFSQSEIQRTNGGGRKNKSGTYRRKTGFMWGLFRGKKQTTTALVLAMGLLFAALLYLPGMIWFDSQTLDSFYRWY